MRKPRVKRFNIERERAEIIKEQEWRHNRFRILVCVNGTDSCYDGLKRAAEFAQRDECDIILLYVRRVDQGLNSGGLQVRVARQNMLDWGLELPGLEFLKKGLKVLEDEGFVDETWKTNFSHNDVFGDPLGDNKVEYRSPTGKSVVLKLKTAHDVVSGVLDQYELGPYNLIVMGPPKRWSSEFASFWEPSSVQKVATNAPCSVLCTRGYQGRKRGFLICIDGSERAYKAMRQAGVLAQLNDRPITLISVAQNDRLQERAKSYTTQGAAMLSESGITRVKTLVRVGDPATEILAASEKFAVVVVADGGTTRVGRFFSGSTAFDVMGKSEISVLNVR